MIVRLGANLTISKACETGLLTQLIELNIAVCITKVWLFWRKTLSLVRPVTVLCLTTIQFEQHVPFLTPLFYSLKEVAPKRPRGIPLAAGQAWKNQLWALTCDPGYT